MLLVVAILATLASLIPPGVRTAEIGRLVEECCACLDREACLQDGDSEEDCRRHYQPIEAMTNQLVLAVDRRDCVAACPDCQALQDDYEVGFTTGTVQHLQPAGE